MGGVLVYVVYRMTGSASHWWLWLAAVCLSLLIDLFLGIVTREVPKVKTKTEYSAK